MTEVAAGAPVVLIRCDATTAGGVGHLVRCVALAQALRRAGAPRIHLSGDVSAPLARDVLAATPVVRHEAVPDSVSLMSLAKVVGATLVHVDHYDGFDDLRAIGLREGLLVSTATDDRFGRRDADVIVDGSPRALRHFDPLYGGASVGLGPAFLALREQFAAAPRRPERDGPLTVLVVMGGTDAGGYGRSIADAVARLPGVVRVGVVGAPADPTQQSAGSTPVGAIPRSADFASILTGWDVVVTGAGTTVWELAALGVPMAVVGVAENQRDHYETLTSGGFAAGMGFLPDPAAIDTRDLSDLLDDASRRRRMAARARRLVDGRGADRIVELWSGALADRSSGELSVRAAGLRDAGRLFAWRDDPLTRTASRTTDPLVWSDHVDWLRAVLGREDRRLFIGTAAGEPVGTVRFDRLSGGEWEVSLTVAPAARGRGLAAALVWRATRALQSAREPVERVVAMLREENAASRAVFAASGYRQEAREDGWERWTANPREFTADPT